MIKLEFKIGPLLGCSITVITPDFGPGNGSSILPGPTKD